MSDDEESRLAPASASEPTTWNDVLRGLRHELRTPINHIVGYSELLEEEAEESGYADRLPDLQRIRTAGRHLLSQVHALLDLAEDLGEDAPEHPDDRAVTSAPAAAVGVAARPSSVQAEHSRVEHPGMLAAKLLVVDDDEENRDMLSRRLERLGYQVALAEDGREALE